MISRPLDRRSAGSGNKSVSQFQNGVGVFEIGKVRDGADDRRNQQNEDSR